VAVAAQDDVVGGSPGSAAGEKIVTIIPADAGWRAIYGGQGGGEESGLSRVVAWALVEDDGGDRRVVGMVIDPQNRSSIVTATGSESAQAGMLTGYGYKER
jgi:hypothetical protein